VDVKIWEKEFCDKISFTATLDDRGRITIPASLKRKLRVSFGSKVQATIRIKTDESEVGFE
jgi:bifunctional DNA-binding transcriptional regulator/antitoxin component of YhaV-PrlF toxin-antitoxin module